MRQPLRNGLLNAGHTCDTLAGDKSLTCLGADDGAPDMAAVADVDQTFFSLSSDFFKVQVLFNGWRDTCTTKSIISLIYRK